LCTVLSALSLHDALPICVNASDSPAVNLTIKEDKEAPTIQVLSPGDVVYDRQPVSLKIAIADTVSISSYRVSVLDPELRELVNRDRKSTRLNSSHVKISY